MRLYTIIFPAMIIGLISTLLLGTLLWNSNAVIYTTDSGNNTNNSVLLVLYNNNLDNNTVQQILAQRGMSTLPHQIEYVRIQNQSTITAINNNNTFLSQVKEYWFVANNMTQITDLSEVNNLLEKLITSNTSGLILTPNIENLTSQIQSQLKITSCEDIIDTENNNATIVYPHPGNLSQLLNLNTTIPSSTNISLRMTAVNCTFSSNSGIYEIAQFISPPNETDHSPTLLLYQPSYKSRITVGLFSIRNYDTHGNASNYRIDNNAILSTQAIKSLPFNGLSFRTSQTQTFTLYKLLALISFQASTGYTTGTGTSSSTSSNPIILPGFNLNPPNWFFPLTIILALASVLLYLLYRFWYAFLGFAIAITTLIYHPYRKLDALDVLKHETRQKIIDILYEQAEHGETFRSLNRKVKIPVQTLLWHLKILQDFSLIETFKIRRELVIVAQEFVQNFSPLMKELELSFKSPQAQSFRSFLGDLNVHDTFTLENVIKSTNWNRKTAQRHLNYLCKLQILNKDPKTSKYSINIHYYDSIRSTILINN